MPDAARRLLTVVSWLIIAVTFAAALAAEHVPWDRQRPNIVFILTDDEDWTAHAFMPKTKALLEHQGTTFERYFVTYPLCCPSRASILRGQYPHNTNVLGNKRPQGGYLVFRKLGGERSTIATWLQAAGYHTAFVGKYMNGYHPERDGVPPGWDDWFGANGGYRNVDYALNENGSVVVYGHDPEDHLTDVIARKAALVIRREQAEGEPFFLYISTFSPHTPANPAPRHAGMFQDEPLPRPPSFDEADVADKPAVIRNLPRLRPSAIGPLEALYRRRLESLQAVDDLVETVVRTLEETGQLDHTYLVYSSDNGHHLGHHRMTAGKNTVYEEDIRVPLIVRGPSVPKGRRLAAMVINNDLAPTFAAMAGIEPPESVDGRSFLPLFEAPGRPWRHRTLIRRRGLGSNGVMSVNSFIALRTATWTYVEYESGERELYDLTQDPYQLDNRAKTADPALLNQLSNWVNALSSCAAASCRELEDQPAP